MISPFKYGLYFSGTGDQVQGNQWQKALGTKHCESIPRLAVELFR